MRLCCLHEGDDDARSPMMGDFLLDSNLLL
jgi:hypothetical protein